MPQQLQLRSLKSTFPLMRKTEDSGVTPAESFRKEQIMYIKIPEYVCVLMQCLEAAGEESYIVGGGLRDTLLGKEPNDYDLATSATPQRMIGIFSKYQTITSGIKHGTITVINDHKPVEITAFRVDGDYSDSRHPDKVRFTRSIEEDLARRDFTVNAMAYNPERGLIDIFGGQDDIEKKIIRAVREPEIRFSEDALRILRAFRFSSRLEFEIEEQTLAAAGKCRAGLKNIAGERINSEFIKTLCSPDPARVLKQMKRLGVLEYILGEYKPSDRIIDLLPKMPVADAARLGFLLSGCEDNQLITDILISLKCSNSLKKNTLAVAKNLHLGIDSQKDVSVLCAKTGDENARYVVAASVLLGISDESVMGYVEKNYAPRTIGDLKIGGGDLIELGLSGRDIGNMLQYLFEKCIDDPKFNERESLIAAAKEKIGRDGE